MASTRFHTRNLLETPDCVLRRVPWYGVMRFTNSCRKAANVAAAIRCAKSSGGANLHARPRQRNILRDIYEVLQQKQSNIARLNHEIAALRLAAPLLVDEGDNESLDANPSLGIGTHDNRFKDSYYATEPSASNGIAHEDVADAGDIDSGTARKVALRIRQLAGPFWNIRRSLIDSAS